MAIDLLNIARTGVYSAQAQLGVTSNNISNVNTEGYNRQVATQVTDNSYLLGGNYFGTGSYVNEVKRIYNDFAAREMRSSQTALSGAETTHTKLSQLDELFSKVGIAVPSSLNDFYASLNSLADQPSDSGIRQNLLTSANQLAVSFNQIDGYLSSEMSQTNDEISSIATRINEISKEIAQINLELQKNQGTDPQLLDKQDTLIQELSKYAEVNVVPIEGGGRSVMFGSSFMLVSGQVAMTLGTQPGVSYPTEPDLTYTLGNTTLKVDASKIGGQLGALFDYRENILQPANQQLGLLALGVADAFNTQQAQGLDLNGNVGQNIFTDINDATFASSRVAAFKSNDATNPTPASLGVSLTDVSELTGNSYELKFDGTDYQLTNLQTAEVSTLTLNGSALEGGNGFVINILVGSMVSGDRFEIRPTGNAAQQIKVEMTDPAGIAAAGAYSADAANSADAQIRLISIDRSNAALPSNGSELSYTIDSAGNYSFSNDTGSIIGSGVAAGTPMQINSNGFVFQIDSLPATGESATYTFDFSGASGDNANAIAMAKLSDSQIMNGGKATLTDVYEQTKLSVGSDTKAAEVRVSSAQSIYDQAYNRVQTESGVNLDEEAANLLRFQQAYQASARVMTTANTIFDTLFNAVR
ncbi:flagellar hook-associated protein FlgK [Shewanella avicenniae]|uniref:Flagellar hook-associated protein 1 n=1 Tax=Shewanella avicenniae TaxID=2814294 RepID=A0ABX7QNA7_9GAMM|nr:flagellar hook-associated protein FlgK [Shewanella avicenniae]QSX32734.1 flagellar hook-associated protein FlgK [Shewanella avicenniae]